MIETITVNSDGGARGNPGPGASAFVVSVGGKIVFKGSRYLGKVTNNIAEYSGAIDALNWLLDNDYLSESGVVRFYLDSELVAKQLSKEYRVKNKDLQKLWIAAQTVIKKSNKKILFKNIPRSQNKLPDFLLNEELDRNQKTS